VRPRIPSGIQVDLGVRTMFSAIRSGATGYTPESTTPEP
jgi:hypothetical protein